MQFGMGLGCCLATKSTTHTTWYLQFKLLPRDTRSLERQAQKLAPQTAGRQWFDLPAQQLTDGTRRDLKLLQLRGTFDPKRFYKSSDHKKGLPKFFQIGTVVESAADFYSGTQPPWFCFLGLTCKDPVFVLMHIITSLLVCTHAFCTYPGPSCSGEQQTDTCLARREDHLTELHYVAGRLSNKERKGTITEELLADPELSQARKRRFDKLQVIPLVAKNITACRCNACLHSCCGCLCTLGAFF